MNLLTNMFKNNKKRVSVTCLMAAFVGLAGCNAGVDKSNVELIQDMMDQRNLKSQDYNEYTKSGANLVPPEGTVPQGFKPYKYAGDALAAEAKLVNPLTGAAAEKLMSRGQEQYRVYCSVCHGTTGLGDGKVAQYMSLKPPSLVTDKVKAFRDGRIYHIITDGQGLMSQYATQIHKTEDRWAIVNYIRTLQR